MRDRAAHPDVAEPWPIQVEAERRHAVAAARIHGGLDQPNARILAEALALRTGNAEEPVHLSGLERNDLRARIRNLAEHDVVERGGAAEIVTICRVADLAVRAVFDEPERSGADRFCVGGIPLRIGARVYMLRKDRRLDHVELLEERGVRPTE